MQPTYSLSLSLPLSPSVIHHGIFGIFNSFNFSISCVCRLHVEYETDILILVHWLAYVGCLIIANLTYMHAHIQNIKWFSVQCDLFVALPLSYDTFWYDCNQSTIFNELQSNIFHFDVQLISTSYKQNEKKNIFAYISLPEPTQTPAKLIENQQKSPQIEFHEFHWTNTCNAAYTNDTFRQSNEEKKSFKWYGIIEKRQK